MIEGNYKGFRQLHSWLVLTACLISSVAARGAEQPEVKVASAETFRPAVPAGFYLHKCHDGKLAFLVPEGWKTIESLGKNALQCFASPDFSKSQDTWTGIEIYLLIRPDELGAMTPEEYSMQRIESARRASREFVDWKTEDERFRYSNCLVKFDKSSAVSSWAISKTTGSGVFITFSSPTSDWSHHWSEAQVVMKNVAVAASL